MIKANLNSLETMCCLLSKLPHLNIIHQVFLVLKAEPVCFRAVVIYQVFLALIVEPVCLRAGMTLFMSTVCMVNIAK